MVIIHPLDALLFIKLTSDNDERTERTGNIKFAPAPIAEKKKSNAKKKKKGGGWSEERKKV